MSLADELLADLEEAAEEEDEAYGDEEGADPLDVVEEEEMQLDLNVDSVKSIAKLRDSKLFAEIISKMGDYIGQQRKTSE
ncbi:U4/U6 small nuclear ribonucleoprotein Prp31-like, partial [Heptranchias perlo]|uniref:U4/U6 small nuclear ribonucleoprotein Prp31-like n=1 Tax=Heptranchias perlo TaxID=212740 RepID=UPI003559ED68